jgi:hypothetical protein
VKPGPGGSGLAAAFPPGTYWLRRFANVPIAS